ncbi:MAG: hypothetical protein KGP29_02805 [Proteobacteria bacterium]|nr:hypothetical protein [Pseudomonadota bacterium]
MRLVRFFILIFLLPLSAQAGLNISVWNEFVQLTEEGKKTLISIEGQVKDLPKNQAMTAFSISFDPKQNISISSVLFEGNPTKYDFVDNVLKIDFPSRKSSGQLVSLKISYSEKYEKINKYLRQEAIYVPDFAVGAFVKFVINFPDHELTTYTKDAIHEGDNLTYTAVAPKEGISKVVKFTPKESVWKVVVKSSIKAEKPLGEFTIKTQPYFQASRQRVENYKTSFTANPTITDRKGSEINYTFRFPSNNFVIETEAKITNGLTHRKQMMRNMIAYTKTTKEEMSLLGATLMKIQSDPIYNGLPIYVAIGRFVNKFLAYDETYIGRLPPLEEVIKGRIGVCTEFAKLYDTLARLAGIPSIIVEGAACGEYDQCQGHSWNMIFYDGRWIEVDPTWDLMSGVVSSSHVFVNEGGKGGVEIKYSESVKNLEMKMDLEMKPYSSDNAQTPKTQN